MFVFSHWSGALTASVTRFLLTENARILKFKKDYYTSVTQKFTFKTNDINKSTIVRVTFSLLNITHYFGHWRWVREI